MTSPKLSPNGSPEGSPEGSHRVSGALPEVVEGPRDHPDVPVPPPLIFAVAMGVGFLGHWIWPVAVRPPGWWGFGVLLVAFGALLVTWSALLFRRAKTDILPWRPTTAIVMGGPYSQTRNPIYLGFALLQVGIGQWTNCLGVVLMVIPAVAATNLFVIAREEAYLVRKFGEEYKKYAAGVRRWL